MPFWILNISSHRKQPALNESLIPLLRRDNKRLISRKRSVSGNNLIRPVNYSAFYIVSTIPVIFSSRINVLALLVISINNHAFVCKVPVLICYDSLCSSVSIFHNQLCQKCILFSVNHRHGSVTYIACVIAFHNYSAKYIFTCS